MVMEREGRCLCGQNRHGENRLSDNNSLDLKMIDFFSLYPPGNFILTLLNNEALFLTGVNRGVA